MRILFFASLTALVLYSYGQLSIGVVAEPTLNIAVIASTPTEESDSIKTRKQHDYTLGYGIEFRHRIDRYQSVTFIPRYHQTNMLLVQRDLQLFDIVHPELTMIYDWAQAAAKNAYLRYRQKYIGLQAIYAKKLQIRGLNDKIKLELGTGIGAYYLLGYDVKIRTEGFSIEGDFTHVITENIGIDAAPFLVNVLCTGDLICKVNPTLFTVAGAKLAFPIHATTTSLPKINILTPSLRVGVRKIL